MDATEQAKTIRDGFQYAPHHPLWKALMLEIDAYRERLVREAADPEQDDKATHFALGGVATLDSFRMELEAQARKAQVEKGEDDD